MSNGVVFSCFDNMEARKNMFDNWCNHIKTNDRVGKYIDKYTGLIGYKFMKTKDTIPVVDSVVTY